MMKQVFIVSAKRTPFGAFGGSLKDVTATDLAAHAIKGAVAESGLNESKMETTIIGNVAHTSTCAPYLARHAALKANLPVPSPSLTLNRLCGSGFQSVISVAQEIQLGEVSVGVAGGTESMSQAPYAVRGIRFGTQLGKNPPFEDTLWASLTDAFIKTPMGITAENLAEMYKITREEVDLFAFESQQKWAEAQKKGIFDKEIHPIEVKGKKGKSMLSVDEGPRPQTTLEALGKLKPTFKPDGVTTAGNASGITDGAAALVLASEETVKEHNLTPLARIVSYGYAGCDPKIMGIGPVPASKIALQRAKLSIKDMDFVEVNEAFAAQALSVQKELGIEKSKMNQHGGAISLGHPLGASGARITSHLAHLLSKDSPFPSSRFALGTACIGGGQGIAIILERV